MTSPSFVTMILDQLQRLGDAEAKKMFGEYALYAHGKLVALICDDRLFLKPTQAARDLLGEVVLAPPYPGAKDSFLIEEGIEDGEWLSKLVEATARELPMPVKKAKAPKAPKAPN